MSDDPGTPRLVRYTGPPLTDDQVAEIRERFEMAMGNLAGKSGGESLDDDDDDEFCIPGCPDDVCRMSGHCAWSADSSGGLR